MQSNNSESLLSQLSNVSYREPKKMYSGAEFFRQSLPPGHQVKVERQQNNEQQIDIDALGISSAFKCYQPEKDNLKIDTLYWSCDHNIEGTSENQEQVCKIQKNQQASVKQDQQAQQKPQSGSQKGNQKAEFQYESQRIKEQSHSLFSSQKNQHRIKNQTKNIPKNFGKAIIIFIEKNPKLLAPIFQNHGVTHQQIMNKLKNLKKKINTIADLRNLWASEPQSRCLRVVSNLFLRKHSLHYIYNSRIKTRLCHSKYKKRLQQAIIDPFQFNHIKEY